MRTSLKSSFGCFFYAACCTFLRVKAIYPELFSTLDVALVEGDIPHNASRWELVPVALGAGTLITYRSSMEPDFSVPLLLGRVMVQTDVRKMLTAVAAEVERRARTTSTVGNRAAEHGFSVVILSAEFRFADVTG